MTAIAVGFYVRKEKKAKITAIEKSFHESGGSIPTMYGSTQEIEMVSGLLGRPSGGLLRESTEWSINMPSDLMKSSSDVFDEIGKPGPDMSTPAALKKEQSKDLLLSMLMTAEDDAATGSASALEGLKEEEEDGGRRRSSSDDMALADLLKQKDSFNVSGDSLL